MKKQLDIERLDSSMDGATSPTTRPISVLEVEGSEESYKLKIDISISTQIDPSYFDVYIKRTGKEPRNSSQNGDVIQGVSCDLRSWS